MSDATDIAEAVEGTTANLAKLAHELRRPDDVVRAMARVKIGKIRGNASRKLAMCKPGSPASEKWTSIVLACDAAVAGLGHV